MSVGLGTPPFLRLHLEDFFAAAPDRVDLAWRPVFPTAIVGDLGLQLERQEGRREIRRRAAVEPSSAHLKAEHRTGRSYLRGAGDDVSFLPSPATHW
jgi:hypothetical protein